MIRRAATIVLAAAAAAAFSAPIASAGVSSSAAPSAKKPNVLVIMADDMRYDDMKWMPQTKKLLGNQGTTFSKHFVTYPLCCPARTTFLTGQLAHNHGVTSVFSPDNFIGWSTKDNNMGAWLQRAGWQTGVSGKYLNGYGELSQTEVPKGWNDWRGSIDESTIDAFNTTINVNGKVTRHGDPDWSNRVLQFSKIVGEGKITEYAGTPTSLVSTISSLFWSRPRPWTFGSTDPKNYTTKIEADGSRAFIAKATKSKKRWFSWYTPPSQHREDVAEQANLARSIGINPRVPEPYLSRVKNLPLDRSAPSFAEVNMSDKREALQSPAVPNILSPECKGGCITKLTDYTRGRAGASMALDDQVAKTVAQLKKSGQLEKTLIIFTSDNGWLLGEHNIPGDKYMPYEESIHVPLLMRGPGIPKGKVNDALVANVDLSPTIVDATGATAGRQTDGMSLLKLIKNPSLARTAVPLEATRKLFVKPGAYPNQWDVPYYGVRTKDYMYAKYTGTGEEELYNLVSDPYEMNNLASVPSSAAKLAEMAQLALELSTCRGSACVR
ncbi:MAG: sulfatase-like hydrolase/transferase [Actinobacteria bacterium]|uniref:Unannotated protein n=1 Tax=freshwater metagenome TaxID=449393 RepID=A0A6J5Z796_9ZZZZ|nr:sulfatase-like hydrolase/transferase [Actinomycetota bacterium]